MYKNALKEDFIRVVEDLDGTVESTDTIVKLKTKIENSSTFERDPDFVKTLIQNCIDESVSRNEREITLEKQKIELAKLQLAKLEKEVELQRAKNKALSLNPAAKVEEKQFETLNKETATHIGIREAEDWLRPIDLAKECDIYISSRSGSHKEIPITYGYTQDPFKNRSQNFKPEIKENYPQNLERENKNCFICGDSSHCARDCEKRFKSKESNDHIHNRINVNTLKIENEKQNSDEFAQQLQYVNIFVENQPVTALIDSGCQIPVLNSSLIRVQTPSEEIITLSSCFGEQRMVEVKPINISLNQHSPSLSVQTAISPTLTEEFIIHPSVYSEIKKLGHAKSDVLLNESESSLGVVYVSNVPVSSVIKNSSYDLPYVKNFNTRNDLSSLIKDYKCNKIKSTKLKLSIIREKCSDIVLCKKVNGAMKKSSVEFISRSPNPSPMKIKGVALLLSNKLIQPDTAVPLDGDTIMVGILPGSTTISVCPQSTPIYFHLVPDNLAPVSSAYETVNSYTEVPETLVVDVPESNEEIFDEYATEPTNPATTIKYEEPPQQAVVNSLTTATTTARTSPIIIQKQLIAGEEVAATVASYCDGHKDQTCPVCGEINSLSSEVYCNAESSLFVRSTGHHYRNHTCSFGALGTLYDITERKVPTMALLRVLYSIPPHCSCPALERK
ncbi:retrovirus-related Pol polyprotein from transposon opus [Trichonephila clavipes]|nr:retrovirus-related Pol polyprotein from transposon opus [Trichonephila clavipes]